MDEEATQQASPDREHPIGQKSFSSVPEDGMLTLLGRVGMHCDWVLKQPEDGSRAEWTFGRNARAQFQFPANLKRLSGIHFKIWATEDNPPTFMLRDVSTNGTYLNSVRIPKERNCMLVNGDIINVGLGVASDEIKLVVSIPQQQTRPGNGPLQLNGVHQHYDFGNVIGQGAFAIVRKAVHRETGKQVAIKIIEKAKLNGSVTDAVKREINILTGLRNDNIVCMLDIFEDTKQYFLVMDYVPYGDLMDALTKDDQNLLPHAEEGHGAGLAEATCRDIVQQVLRAIEYMHGRGISHRDLKPDNILIDSVNPVVIKVADFGLAKLENQGTFLKTFCGTLSYLAPEVLASRNNALGSSQQPARSQSTIGYTQKVDIWSVGCLAYVILTGCMPFGGSTQEEMYRTVLSGDYHKGPIESSRLSPGARSFLETLLEVDPSKRPEASDALKLAWFNTQQPPTELKSGISEEEKWSQPRQRVASHLSSMESNSGDMYHEHSRVHSDDFASSVPSLEHAHGRSSFVTGVGNLHLQSSMIQPPADDDDGDSDQDSEETRHKYDIVASQQVRASDLAADPRSYADNESEMGLMAPEGTFAILRTDPQSIPFKDICLTRDKVIIGRDTKLSDVWWNTPFISRQQCVIERVPSETEPGKFELWFENLSQTIMSFVLDTAVPPRHRARIYNGDAICVTMYALPDAPSKGEGLKFNLEIVDPTLDTTIRKSPVELIPVASPSVTPPTGNNGNKREHSSEVEPRKRAHTLAS